MSEPSAQPATDEFQRLRVAIDAGPLYGHRTGVGVATAGILEALAARDDVDLDPYVVSFRSKPAAGHRRLPVPGIVASHLWARSQWPRFDPWAGAAQVIHGTNYVVPPTRLPSVVSVYDCWFLRHPDNASPVVRRSGERLRRAIAAGAYVHASSDDTADHVRRLFGTERVETIRLGLPPAPPPLSSLAQPAVGATLRGHPFVLAIGTEERRKALPLLVAAFGSIAGDHGELRLVLAGADGDDSQAVEQAITSLPDPVRERVFRIGAVDDPTKHWLLRRAAVLAYPSLDEGFGFPILEAQLAATPVVASDVGAVSEIGGDGVLLVGGRDPSAFAAALGRAIADGGLRLGLIEAGNRNVRRFDWADTAARLVTLYRELVDESAAAAAAIAFPATQAAAGRSLAGAHSPAPVENRPLSDVDRVTVLAGGVGAARFLRGLVATVEPDRITAIVNTGDDTELHGLAISPDVDTIVYTLAGAIDPDRGRGLAGESWQAMTALARFEAERPEGSSAGSTWFRLGDRDLATHLYRTARYAEDATPTEVTAEMGRSWGIGITLLPMTEGRFRTMIHLAGTGEVVSFQDYFVRLQHGVAIESISFEQRECELSPVARTAIEQATMVVIAPSNPLVSIGPIRALPGVDSLLTGRRDSVVAVSPIVGGHALKGPADRMMAELGVEPTVAGVARLYAPIAATLVVDTVDAHLAGAVEAAGMRCVVTPTVMTTPESARSLALATLAATR